MAPALPPLMSAGYLLARTGLYGMAWLDDDFIVNARFGELSEGLAVGEPLYASLPILADYEDDIRALPPDPMSSFELPGILLVKDGPDQPPRVDIHVFRHQDNIEEHDAADADARLINTTQFLLFLTRAGSRSGNDLAVARMQRDRHILLEQIEQQKLALDGAYRELELCNRDLEDFASIVSHDLKAPMRSLRYLADDIETALDQNDQSQARAACEDLKAQSRRMSSMLTQLLDYASLGRQQTIMDKVDTRALVTAVIASLPQPKGMAIEVTGDWPELETYIAPLDLVLRNLIGNAIKHHDRSDTGRISIVASQNNDQLLIEITDDGPGIPKAHQKAIFFPFRTFATDKAGQTSSLEASHGMGLAFVQRTLEAVGGAIELHSAPETHRGTKFKVHWPLAMSQKG